MMAFDTAAHPHSLMGSMDPRAKLLAAGGFSLLTALVQGVPAASMALCLGLAAIVTARLRPAMVLRRALAVNAFVAFLWVLLPWQLNLGPAKQAAMLTFNPPGLDLAFLITLKVNAVFLGLLGLLGSSSMNDLLHAMAHLRMPPKLVTLFLLFWRYLFVMRREYERLTQAMRVRGFRPGNNALTYRTYANLVGMLLVRSFDRSDRVYQAMLLRGFDGTFWLVDHFGWHRRDSVFMTVTAVALFCLGLMEWGV